VVTGVRSNNLPDLSDTTESERIAQRALLRHVTQTDARNYQVVA